MSKAQTLSRRVTIPDEVVHQHIDGGIVLLHLTTEHYYGLDDVGSRTWELLKEHVTVERIVSALLSEYDVDESTLRGDIDRLLDDLADAGLVEVHEEPGP